jgi:predicted secreted Zn-dependent protease
VSAVTVRPAAVAALSDIVPVLARDTVDTGDLVVGQPIALAHPLELLQAKDEQGPLVGLVEEHLSDLQARVDISRDTGDGDEASRLPLLEVLVLIVDVIEFQILGERLGSSVGESRGSKRQGTEKRRELHDCD